MNNTGFIPRRRISVDELMCGLCDKKGNEWKECKAKDCPQSPKNDVVVDANTKRKVNGEKK